MRACGELIWRNRSRAGTGTGPFFGELSHLATHTLAENTDLSPSLPARERLRDAAGPFTDTATHWGRVDWTYAGGNADAT